MASPAREARDEPQLPDLDVIARCYQSIATELPKFRNIPAFNQGAEILNEMRGMREEMQRMNEKIERMDQKIERMDQKIERMDQKIDKIDDKSKAMDVNNVARLVNSYLTDPNAQLSPLHNIATNEPIDRFPASPGAIQDMPATALNTVLRALGMETTGGMELKRQRLRVQIGLKALPV